jgi:hypothetical protein
MGMDPSVLCLCLGSERQKGRTSVQNAPGWPRTAHVIEELLSPALIRYQSIDPVTHCFVPLARYARFAASIPTSPG